MASSTASCQAACSIIFFEPLTAVFAPECTVPSSSQVELQVTFIATKGGSLEKSYDHSKPDLDADEGGQC